MTRTKYAALESFLKAQTDAEVAMTFSQIERIIGDELPMSAYKHRPWWSNNPANSAITNSWLSAGFKTEQVDMEGQKLVFRRTAPALEKRAQGVGEEPSPYAVGQRHPLFGALEGTIRVAPGTDITEPADPDWGASAE
jgi:hypothetical protein